MTSDEPDYDPDATSHRVTLRERWLAVLRVWGAGLISLLRACGGG